MFEGKEKYRKSMRLKSLNSRSLVIPIFFTLSTFSAAFYSDESIKLKTIFIFFVFYISPKLPKMFQKLIFLNF